MPNLQLHGTKTFALISLLALFANYADAQTLCRANERIIFSCKTINRKIISLCSTGSSQEQLGLMSYRFGRDPSSVELEYPTSPDEPQKIFKYFAYSFAKGSSIALAFERRPYRYSLFRTKSAFGYNGAGVIVSKSAETVATIKCHGESADIDELGKLAAFHLPTATVDDVSFIGPEE